MKKSGDQTKSPEKSRKGSKTAVAATVWGRMLDSLCSAQGNGTSANHPTAESIAAKSKSASQMIQKSSSSRVEL
jgi:hypothetical protein